MLARIVEAFFRNQVIFVLPFIAFVTFGVATALSSDKEFGSNGTVFIDRPVIGQAVPLACRSPVLPHTKPFNDLVAEILLRRRDPIQRRCHQAAVACTYHPIQL